MINWNALPYLVASEVRQRAAEGFDVRGFAKAVQTAHNNEAALRALYVALQHTPPRADFAFVEPTDLDEIRREQPSQPNVPQMPSRADSEWADRFYGAWLGRCIGCALGKPLEEAPLVEATNGPIYPALQQWFAGADAWPIRGYVPAHSRAAGEPHMALNGWAPLSTREEIHYMEPDDDIRYTLLALRMLEERGDAFDSWDIGCLWQQSVPIANVATAEWRAYLNFTQIVSPPYTRPDPDDWARQADWVRTEYNPYREWIGAQIRADGWGYGAAGNPSKAAELAWRDASFSHVKNGVYGAMYMAAMVAAAFVEPDIERVVEIGLAQIPQRSRLAADIRTARDIAHTARDQADLLDRVWSAFHHYFHVHTNNNAALVTAALLWGKGDFESALTTAILGGWDTDCNGATVGSIMGAMVGAEAIPTHWKEPLHDTLYSGLLGFHPIPISEVARRTHVVFRALSASGADS